ncbi:MAG: thioredoxin [Firmicutes bacterium]|nr:thioredoxin [Bacillota bacterium]
MIETIKNNDFSKVEASKVSVVDFSATWCGPCKMLAPVFHEIAEEYENVDFYSCDVDENNELAAKFGIMSVPTLMVFEKGKAVDSLSGFRPKEQLKDWIDSSI